MEPPFPLRPPPALPSRPVIRVVHPAGTLIGHEAALAEGLTALEAAGCRVRWDSRRAQTRHRGYLAGPDTARAEELIAALTEPEVDAVWFARGGSGTARLLPWILPLARTIEPRVVIGFSDATSLLNALAAQAGWITFHGPVVTRLARADMATDLDAILQTLGGELELISVPVGPDLPVRGRLMGGNLTVLASLAGTSGWPPVPDALWLIEEVGERPYAIDRALTQLRGAGLFAGARGLWLGDLGLEPGETTSAVASLRADLSEHRVLTGAPAGHRGSLAALPIGGAVELRPQEGRLRALSPWVRRRVA